jgi:hypothetical protein
MLRLVKQSVAMEERKNYPGSFNLWTAAVKLGISHELRGGMPISEAKDIVSRAEFAAKAARAGTHCSYADERCTNGDFTVMKKRIRGDSPELVRTVEYVLAENKKRQEAAGLVVKRSLKTWPTCRFGGTLNLRWDDDGLCYWSCTHCK